MTRSLSPYRSTGIYRGWPRPTAFSFTAIGKHKNFRSINYFGGSRFHSKFSMYRKYFPALSYNKATKCCYFFCFLSKMGKILHWKSAVSVRESSKKIEFVYNSYLVALISIYSHLHIFTQSGKNQILAVLNYCGGHRLMSDVESALCKFKNCPRSHPHRPPPPSPCDHLTATNNLRFFFS